MVYLTCFLSWRQQDRKSSTGEHFSGVSPLSSSHSLQIAHHHPTQVATKQHTPLHWCPESLSGLVFPGLSSSWAHWQALPVLLGSAWVSPLWTLNCLPSLSTVPGHFSRSHLSVWVVINVSALFSLRHYWFLESKVHIWFLLTSTTLLTQCFTYNR